MSNSNSNSNSNGNGNGNGNGNERRPLTSRNTVWAQKITQRLASTNIQPNQVSFASLVFAALAGVLFFLAPQTSGPMMAVLLVMAALMCQCRLLCNLFDGLLAIEAGRQSADGLAWNEFPDRYADLLIMVGLGYGVGIPSLGWAAAFFSVLTAYTRELGNNTGAGSDFSGPMAKQHRMAILTFAALIAAIIAAFAPVIWPAFTSASTIVLTTALAVVATGAAVTALRRTKRMLNTLNSTQ